MDIIHVLRAFGNRHFPLKPPDYGRKSAIHAALPLTHGAKGSTMMLLKRVTLYTRFFLIRSVAKCTV